MYLSNYLKQGSLDHAGFSCLLIVSFTSMYLYLMTEREKKMPTSTF